MNAERIHCCSFTFGETCTSFASYVIHFFEHEHAFHIVLRTLLFNFFAGFPALVGLSGLEPPTSRLSGVRSNRLSYKPIFFRLPGSHLFALIRLALYFFRRTRRSRGGDERDRTDDPLLAKQVLSQLSYTPIFN